MSPNSAVPVSSVGEWMRIFAVLFARKRPDVSAEQVVATAINEYQSSHTLAPEEAVARCCD